MAPLRKWHPSGPAAQPSGLLALELPRRRWGAARSSTVARWSKGDEECDPSLATAEAEGQAVLQGKPASESNWSLVDSKGNDSSVEAVQQEHHASESNWSVVDGKGNNSSVEAVQQENTASESNWSVVDGKGNNYATESV